jgi:hypothetical protein
MLQFKRLKLHQFLAEGTKDGTDEEHGEGQGARRYAHVCSRMLTYAHVCSCMLTYAHVR